MLLFKKFILGVSFIACFDVSATKSELLALFEPVLAINASPDANQAQIKEYFQRPETRALVNSLMMELIPVLGLIPNLNDSKESLLKSLTITGKILENIKQGQSDVSALFDAQIVENLKLMFPLVFFDVQNSIELSKAVLPMLFDYLKIFLPGSAVSDSKKQEESLNFFKNVSVCMTDNLKFDLGFSAFYLAIFVFLASREETQKCFLFPTSQANARSFSVEDYLNDSFGPNFFRTYLTGSIQYLKSLEPGSVKKIVDQNLRLQIRAAKQGLVSGQKVEQITSEILSQSAILPLANVVTKFVE